MGELSPEIFLSSFGFKMGVTPSANLVLDCRFLPDPRLLQESNPHLTGKHRAVEDFIRANASDFDTFFNILTKHVRELIRASPTPSKISLALGCTAGKNRSVFMAEHLARWLREEMHHTVLVCHRDMEADAILSNALGFDHVWEEEDPACWPRLKCTYHPDTLTLETCDLPGLQRPEDSKRVQDILGTGVTKLKTLREKRAREVDASTGSDFAASCNDLHDAAAKWLAPPPLTYSQTI
ncbi:P-loop ATPase protein family-domain-containing protein [Baffinella frigidus]|nr:P-loop ATPase protein family-domain-containing protein [Cryptophyta sp. CCMP2293]